MLQLIRKTIKKYIGSTILFVLALIIILIFLPFSIQSIQNAQTETEKNITHYARGTYDILIRPAGSMTPIEEKRGIVHENYIGFGEGGITLDEWRSILNRDDVEIAAPVASLGYYTGISNIIAYNPPEQSTFISTRQFTSDGVNRYPVTETFDCTLLDAGEHNQGGLMITWFEPVFKDYNPFGFDSCSFVTAHDVIVAPYHHVVAIDPYEEEKLIGIDFSGITEEAQVSWAALDYLQRTEFDTELIKIMELDGESISLEVDSIIKDLNISQEDTRELLLKYNIYPQDHIFTETPDESIEEVYSNFSHYIYSNPDEYDNVLDDIFSYGIDDEREFTNKVGNLLTPFNQDLSIVIDPKSGDFREKQEDDYTIWVSWGMELSTVYYTASPIKYEDYGDYFKVAIVGKDELGIPIYREINKHGKNTIDLYSENESPPFFFGPTTSFTLNEYEETLASSPLGIYQLAPSYYIEDGQEIPLTATITPGSFVTPPAKGVVNIEDAELIKGEAPIDAIRVKVAGIDKYTPSAAEKIEAMAKEFEEQGYVVNIVAGASPQYIEVEVEGIGRVRESWTTLGAAEEIINQWNMTNTLLSVSFIFVVFSYLFSRMRFWQIEKREDVILYNDLGWRKRDQLKLFRKEIIAIFAFSAFTAFPLLYFMNQQFYQTTQVYIIFSIMVLLTFMILLFMLSIKFQQVFKNNGVLNQPRVKINASLFMKNITYFRSFISSSFIQIALVSMLLPLIFIAIYDTVDQTNLTLLGEYINLQVSDIHILLLIAVGILTIFTLFESTTSLFIVRQDEFALLKDLGWKRRHIFVKYLKEAFIWIMTSIIIGHLLAFVLILYFYQLTISVWISLAISAMSVLLFSILVTSINIYRYIKKVNK